MMTSKDTDWCAIGSNYNNIREVHFSFSICFVLFKYLLQLNNINLKMGVKCIVWMSGTSKIK